MQIQVQNLKKWFGDKQVLHGLNFDIKEGQFVALLGPSGCGKTTLLNILAGFLDVEEGSVKVGGHVWTKPKASLAPEKRNVGMVFQDFALWPHMTVFENIAFGLKLRKFSTQEIKKRVHEVLETVRMTGYETKFPHELSGGQKQRIAIARALAPEPSVLLMDEPLSSLDAKLREQMRWDMLEIIRRAGITTVYVTHDQAEALSMADKIILLNEGHVEQEGTPTDMYFKPKTVFTATFLGVSNLVRGTVRSVCDGMVGMDCSGQRIQARGEALIGEFRTISIRPSDIQIYSYACEPEQQNSLSVLEGVIYQRAFHGSEWRYRVQISAVPEMQLEVWEERELPLDSKVYLGLPVERALMLVEAESSVYSRI